MPNTKNSHKKKNLLMRGYVKIWIVILMFFTIAADVEKDIPENWCITEVEIGNIERVDIEQVDVGKEEGCCYICIYRYKCPESTVEDSTGKKITGPIELHTFYKRKPKEGQRLKGVYNKEAPSELQLLEEVVYEE